MVTDHLGRCWNCNLWKCKTCTGWSDSCLISQCVRCQLKKERMWNRAKK